MCQIYIIVKYWFDAYSTTGICQSAPLGQFFTHSMLRMNSLPFCLFIELSVTATFVGQTRLQFPQEIHFSLSHFCINKLWNAVFYFPFWNSEIVIRQTSVFSAFIMIRNVPFSCDLICVRYPNGYGFPEAPLPDFSNDLPKKAAPPYWQK